MTETTAPTVSTTASAIEARDFSERVTDPNRDEWKSGAMHHLIKALAGAPVAVVLEKATGFTMVNVKLTGVRQTPGYGTFQVLVEDTYSDGNTGRCWYPLYKVGTVIELGKSRARWVALDSYREERTQAVLRLQGEIRTKLGLEDNQPLPRGEWDAQVFNGYVHASFAPPFGKERVIGYTWKRYASADLPTRSR